MVNEIRSRQNPENVWWPWIASFGIAFLSIRIHQYLAVSLGLMLLFLNWLRMGKFKKVLLLSVLSMFYIVLLCFTDYGNSTFNLWDDWSLAIWVGQVAVTLLIIGLLSAIGWNDVRKFVARGETPKQISKWTGLLLAIFMLLVYCLIGFGLDYFSQKVGYCKFPTVYDLVAEHQEAAKDGLGGLLARRKDVGCGWTWNQGKDDAPNFTFSGDHAFFYGWDDVNQLYYIEQAITEKDNYAPSTTGALSYLEGDVIDVALMKIPQANFYESKCVGEGVIKKCAVVVGFDHIVYGLDVRSVFTGDDQFEMVVNTILAKAVERILEYEAAFP